VVVRAPECEQQQEPRECSNTNVWNVNVPRSAPAPQCHLASAANGNGVGVVFPGLEEERTCSRAGPTVVRLSSC